MEEVGRNWEGARLIVDKGGGEKGVEGVSKQGEHLSAIMMMVAEGGGPLWCRGCGWQQGGAWGLLNVARGPMRG